MSYLSKNLEYFGHFSGWIWAGLCFIVMVAANGLYNPKKKHWLSSEFDRNKAIIDEGIRRQRDEGQKKALHTDN